jgi:CHAD domain-containing protein
MSVALKQKTNVSKQYQEIALDLLSNAQKALSKRGNAASAEGVHNSRKKFKQLRGLLRLTRYGLGPEMYDRLNTDLRDAGRPLSEVRDADVMIEALDNLVEHFKKKVPKGSFKKLRLELVKRRTRIRKRVLEKEKAMVKVSRLTKKIRTDINKWPSFPDRFGIPKKGVRKIYDRGQEEMDLAFKEPSVENLHEWRKSVKYLRYQLEFLQSIKEKVLAEMAEQAHQLADALGLDHDLAVLEELLQRQLRNATTSKQLKLLVELINQRRAELQDEAKDLGPQIYADTPTQFLKRLKTYWKNWDVTAKAAA